MILTKAKCPACGGALDLNPDLERGLCVYCGSEFLVREAIQKFKAEVDGLPTLKNMLIRAEQKLSDGDGRGAMALYEKILEGAPTCHEAWWGKFLSIGDYEGHPRRGLPDYFDAFQKDKNGWCGNIRSCFELSCLFLGDDGPGKLQEEKEILGVRITAIDRRDLKLLFGDNLTNAFRAIEYAPEEQKAVYQQRLDGLLEDCKRIAEEMRERLVKKENELKGKRTRILSVSILLVVFPALIGGRAGTVGFIMGLIVGGILGGGFIALSIIFS